MAASAAKRKALRSRGPGLPLVSSGHDRNRIVQCAAYHLRRHDAGFARESERMNFHRGSREFDVRQAASLTAQKRRSWQLRPHFGMKRVRPFGGSHAASGSTTAQPMPPLHRRFSAQLTDSHPRRSNRLMVPTMHQITPRRITQQGGCRVAGVSQRRSGGRRKTG